MSLDNQWLAEVNARLASVSWSHPIEDAVDIRVEILRDSRGFTLRLEHDRILVHEDDEGSSDMSIRLDASWDELRSERVDLLELLGAGRLTVRGGAEKLISLAPALGDIVGYAAGDTSPRQ